MGNNSSIPSTAKPARTKPSVLCCSCLLSKSSSSSSLSIDEKYFPTFDRLKSDEKVYPSTPIVTPDETDKSLSTAHNRRSVSLHNVIAAPSEHFNGAQGDQPIVFKPPLPPGKSRTASKLPPTGRSFRGSLGDTKRTYHSQSIQHARLSIEDLEKSLHGSSSIDQWIDSLRILGTPSLNRNKSAHPSRTVASTNNKKIKRSLTIGDEYDDNVLNGSYRQENDPLIAVEPVPSKPDFPNILTLKFNREFLTLAKAIHLNVHLKDFLTRVTSSKAKQTFKNHFSLSTIIYPFSGVDQTLADDLHLLLTTPLESILPELSSNTHSSYKTSEQLRSKCYFIPSTDCKVDADDDEYRKRRVELDRTHVVITLDNKTREADDSKKPPAEPDSTCIFASDDGFQTGLLRIEREKVPKHLLPFVFQSPEDASCCLSASSLQQWFQTLLLVNQTCAIAKRFLTGDGSHITCLVKEPTSHTSSLPIDTHVTFAALRLPPCLSLSDSSQTNADDEDKPTIIDAFSPTFLSENKKASSDAIHIDYEQYAFAFLLPRWPKSLSDNYYTQPTRNAQRKWPSKYHLNIIVKRPLLLVPTPNSHRWQLNFDLVEQSLFESMNESTVCFYALCQQLFASTADIRTCVKHCFFNYCEKYGLPFSNQRAKPTDNIEELMSHFLREIHSQITAKAIPNYFNPEINLYATSEPFTEWFDYVNRCVTERVHVPAAAPPATICNRPIIVEFLFHFIDQLYQTFHMKRSQFHLNEHVLLGLHKQLCERLSNDTNNNSTSLHKSIHHLLSNPQLLEQIESSLTYDFESNAELVHTCLNQVRKADCSLIFHYTWTIYVQYLHTYYNVLWDL